MAETLHFRPVFPLFSVYKMQEKNNKNAGNHVDYMV